MDGRFRHHTALPLVSDNLLNGDWQAQDIFDNALTDGVLSPCEAQGVSEVLGCARTEPPMSRRISLTVPH